MQLSIIIINWNTRQLLASCLHSIQAHVTGLDFDVWVVDNASSDDSIAMLTADFPTTRIIRNVENVGFARANNQAMRQSTGEFVLLLNSDAFLTPDAIESLMAVMRDHPKAGIVGARLLNADGSFQASHTPFPQLGQEFMMLTTLGRLLHGYYYPSRGPEIERGPQTVDYVQGACLLARRTAFDQVGLLDEGYFMYSEEVDWCYTIIQGGWEVWYQPAAAIIHLGGASSRNRPIGRETDLYRSRVRFFRKHYGAAAATSLIGLILTIAAIKGTVLRLARLLPHNRPGRPIVGLRALAKALQT